MKIQRTTPNDGAKSAAVRVEVSPLYDLFLSLFAAGNPNADPKPDFVRSWKSRLSRDGRKAYRFFFETEEHLGLHALTFALRLPCPRTLENYLTLLRGLKSDDFCVTVVAALEPSSSQLPKILRDLHGQSMPAPEEASFWEDFRGRFSSESRSRIDRLLHDPSLAEDLANLLEEHWRLFLDEEYRRLLPFLQESAQVVEVMAQTLSPAEIIPYMARGLLFPPPAGKRLTFAPAYYAAPFVFLQESESEYLLIFPATAAIAQQQADEVKAELIRSYKALADPTRLEILRLLRKREMYALEISRTLRLTHPTVLHHMAALRVGGFVQTELRRGNNYYALKNERSEELRLILEKYLTAERATVDNHLQEDNDGHF
ncbi:MAG: metalloregulator ArsR/SmtB family transcription factor [Coprothermobacterota bacterium]|nr:metalloregulator ArsR/SmtB family transcription factor [Coprothermobacterota bacterium]